MAAQSSGNTGEAGALRKVIIRYSDGRIARAYLPAQEELASASWRRNDIALRDSAGGELHVDSKTIKAIFLVKTFEGNPEYVEFKTFPHRPAGPGLWVRVLFADSESLEGVAPNSLATFADSIFYMTPPDPRSNNQAVLVSKVSLSDMHILGFEEVG